MKKLILVLALLTAGNLTAGAVYASVCESAGGSRACGSSCVVLPNGGCSCQGSCSAAELNWVDGGAKSVAQLAELAN